MTEHWCATCRGGSAANHLLDLLAKNRADNGGTFLAMTDGRMKAVIDIDPDEINRTIFLARLDWELKSAREDLIELYDANYNSDGSLK